MLTQVEVFGVQAIPQLVLPIFNAEDEPIQIKGIDGLGPVKATVDTTEYGVIPGAAVTGTSVGTRNIVFTLGLNPDWETQTYEEIRKQLARYFMPQSTVTLRFTSTHLPTCEIIGIVEDMAPNMFSKDPEVQISIICGRPEFVAVEKTIVTGVVGAPSVHSAIDYIGTAWTGLTLDVESSAARGAYTGKINVEFDNGSFNLTNITVDPTRKFELNSVPGSKYVRSIALPGGEITNLLGSVVGAYVWPKLVPGVNGFGVTGDLNGQAWTLSYFAKFGLL